MKLVPDWKDAPRWFSMQAMVIAGAIQSTWAVLPLEMKESIPQEWISYATVVLLVLGTLGRLIDQE